MKHQGAIKYFLMTAAAAVIVWHLSVGAGWAADTLYCYQRPLTSHPAHYFEAQYEWTACAAGSYVPNSCLKCTIYMSDAQKSGRAVLVAGEGKFKNTWGTGTRGIAENCIEITLNTLAYNVSTDGCGDPDKWLTTMPQ